MLISLTAQNFKKHEHLSVNFTAGTNGIYGANYKGKTTILYAILFALGGSSHVPGNRLVRLNSDGRMKVALTFLIGEDTFTAERGKTSANLFKNGTEAEHLVATSSSAVTAEIERLIGMSIKQWKELHYAKQKNAHALLRYSATNLHLLLRRLVGAEELDQVQTRLKVMGQRDQAVIDTLVTSEGTVEDTQVEVNNLTSQTASLEQTASSVAGELAELEKLSADQRSQVDTLTGKLLAEKELKSAAEQHALRVQAAGNGVAAAEREYELRQEACTAAVTHKEGLGALDAEGIQAQLDVSVADDERLAAAQNVQNAARAALGLAARAALGARDALAAARAELANQQQIVVTAGSAVEAHSSEGKEGMLESLEEVRVAIASRTAAHNTLNAALEGAECPTCKRPMEDHNPEQLRKEMSELRALLTQGLFDEQELVEALKQLGDLELAVSSANLKLESLVDAVAKAEASVVAATSAEEEATSALDAAEKVTSNLSGSKVDRTALRQQLLALASANQAVRAANEEFTKADIALVTAKETLKLVSLQRGGDLGLIDAAITEISAGVSTARELLRSISTQLEGSRTREREANAKLSASQSQLKVAEAKLERVKVQGARLDIAAKRLAKIQHLQKYLKENAETYMSKAWSGFMAHAGQFASLCTGGDIESLNRTDDGDFSFTEGGLEMQLEEASGAQEAIIGLAVQMALASAAPCHLNVLLLDEPTADMDPDRSMASLVALGMLGQQVVFVSHHQTDNAICSNAITL